MERERLYRRPHTRRQYQASEYWIVPDEPYPLKRKDKRLRNALVSITAGAVIILVLPYVFTAFLLSSAIYLGWQLIQSLTGTRKQY